MRNILAALLLSLCFAATVAAQGVSPESAEKYTAGQDLFKKRRYQEAVKAFEEAVSLDGKNAQAYRAMGKIAEAEFDEDTARNWRRRAKVR